MLFDIVVADPRLTPTYANEGDAGMDLRANLAEPIKIFPGECRAVPTGLKIALVRGVVGLVCPRSGLAKKHGITVANAPGIIDAGFRGEIQVLIRNHGDDPFSIAPFDRIAQLLVMPVWTIRLNPVDGLDDTVRGEGGFGSSGVQ